MGTFWCHVLALPPDRKGLYTVGIALLFHYIIANDPSMVFLRNVARAIFGPPSVFKWEGLDTQASICYTPGRNTKRIVTLLSPSSLALLPFIHTLICSL